MRNNIIFIFALYFVSFILSGCSTELEDIGYSDGEKKTVSIETRAFIGEESIEYPICIYAFRTSDGKMIEKIIAENEEDKLELALSEGSYKLVAMSGYEDLNLPETPTLQSSIGIHASGILSEALRIGRANLTVEKKNATVEIVMEYQVVHVNLALNDIPEDVTNVSVTFSTMHKELSFDGNLSGANAITLDLTKDEIQGNDVWSTSNVYIMSGKSTQLTLSISMTNATATNTHGYTHASNLEASTPYVMAGSYKGKFTINGSISGAGWKETKHINFTFGPGSGEDNTDPENGNEPDEPEGGEAPEENPEDGTEGETEYLVSALPQPADICNGHLVAIKVSADATSAELLLMSLKEWLVTPEEALNIEYIEGDGTNKLTDWRIPTKDEMETISSTIGNNLNKTNSVLEDAGGDKLVQAQEDYLCENATKRTVLGQKTSVSAQANEKYRLRLVKTIRVKLAE